MGGKRGAEVAYDIYGKTVSERMACSPPSTNSEENINLSHRALDGKWRSLHTQHVVDVEEDIPEDWTKVEDDFVGVYAVTLSHISNDGPFAPQARMDDDRIYLTYILRNDVSNRLDLLKFLTSIESQKHLDLPFVK
ncbi:hypothetical protein OSTOST_06714, partial [Ostertagia ostertagi]